jgi:S-adenosylmethionine-dependent methyltransferase
MTRSAPERFDADPSAYEEYLRTPLGRLRLELSWRNLEPHLPCPGTPPPGALDLGAGTGEMALRLAAAGWSVTLVDGSRRMLGGPPSSRRRGGSARIAPRARPRRGGLADALGTSAYDLVVCHDVLEYVASPEALLRVARSILAPAGLVSLVVRNRPGEVMKRLLRGADPEAALRLLADHRVREDLYGLDLRLFDLGEVRRLLGAAGLEVVAEHGVRVVADHLADWTEGATTRSSGCSALERRLGDHPELRAVAVIQ